DESSYGCRIIGVLKNKSSNKEWNKPNLNVLIPYSTFQALSGNWWSSSIRDVILQLIPGSDIEKVGNSIKAYFHQKYGPSGKFRSDSDSILIAQMQRFLTLFTILLTAIAFVT